MPFTDNQSPFSNDRKKSNAQTAFRVLVLFSLLSFLGAVAAVYFSYIYESVPSVSYNLSVGSVQSSLINPQPPEAKPIAEESTENAALIQEMEDHKKSMDETAESLKQEIDNPTIKPTIAEALVEDLKPAPVSAEKVEIEQLHKEQMADIDKQLKRIEELKVEQNQIQIKKEEKILVTAAGVKSDVAAEDIKKAENEFSSFAGPAQPPVDVNEKPKLKDFMKPRPHVQKDLKAALTRPAPVRHLASNELPPPDLVQTSLVASLPDFSLIMQKPPQNAIPLHIIEPLAELQEENKYGKLPIQDNNNSPLKAYSAQVSVEPTVPYISVLVSGLGKRQKITQSAINSLPAAVSLSFSPYADNLEQDVAAARRMGHETFIDLPMQHGTFPETDPGPLGLVSGLPEQENRKRLNKVMGRNVAYIGLAGQRNQNFSYYSATQMKAFADEIYERGLLIVGGSDDPNMPMFQKTLRPDVYIADDLYRAAIRKRLDDAKKIAMEKGRAFVRIEAYPVSLVALIEFIKSFEPTQEDPNPKLVFEPVSYYAEQIRGSKK